jgi:hypothetical protein
VASGSPIDTSTAGAHSFTVHTSDRAGNSASQIVTYSVKASGGGVGTPTPTVTTFGRPTAKAQGKTVLVNPGIKLSCPPGGKPCIADETASVPVPVSMARAKTKRLVIGRAHVTIPAGRSKQLTFKLNSKGAKLLRKLGHLRITVTVISRVDHNTPITTTQTFTIKAPARKHRR